MGLGWRAAALSAFFVTAAATPWLSRLALATGFVDQPSRRRRHGKPVAYLGGVGLIAGVLVGLTGASRLNAEGVAIVLGAVVLGTIGLVDDRRSVDPRIRLMVESSMAVFVVLAGLRMTVVGVPSVDAVITVVWIVGITNAFNLCDNMDGLATGIAATAAGALFVLTTLGGKEVSAIVAAALCAACLGFLPYNRRPASIFMGDAGSLFLGFALAVLAIEVDPQLSPPASFMVPLLLSAVPLLDMTTVVLARLRHGRRVWSGGRDHLSHRLVARGLSRGQAVGTLILTEAVMGALALSASRRLIPPWAVVAAASAVLVRLGISAGRARVYSEPVVGWPRWARLLFAGSLAGVALLVVPAGLAIARAERPGRTGVALVTEALRSFGKSSSQETTARFRQARLAFRRASTRLDAPMVSFGLAVPGLSSNLETSRTLVSIGERLAATGERWAVLSEADQLRVTSGSVSLEEIRRLEPLLADAARLLESSRSRLAAANRLYVVPPLERALNEVSEALEDEALLASRSAQAARLLPGMLGGDGTRRYFLAFQNNSELRGTGGFIGNWGEVVAEGGKLRLDRFGRLDDLIFGGTRPRVVRLPPEFLERYRGFDVAQSWTQVNVSPDFPTTARLITDLYPQSGGRPVDGVIAVDPIGLAALLELTGPVAVPGWPEPVTASNVVDITLRAAYERYLVQAQRVEFLGTVARRVWEAFTAADLGNPAMITRSLARATGAKHLMVYSRHSEEQRLITDLGADGAVRPLNGDFLMVVDQNVSANKVDLYLQRRLRYEAVLDPSSDPGWLTGRLELTLKNGAPPQGLPLGVIGPYDDRFAPGENRTYVSIYSPLTRRSSALDGKPFPVESQPELGRLAHSATVSIPALSSRTLRLDLEGRTRLDADGWYRLDVGRQPLVLADEVDVSITVPAGWRIAEVRGLQRAGDRRASTQFRLDQDRSLWLRVEPTGWAGFWHRLRDG